jgi:death on curing protein
VKNSFVYLTFERILIIHDEMIEHYSGSHGVRDLPLLESALARPQATFAAEDLYKTVFDKAAVLIHSIIMNHAFVDGNKRTATASMEIFLDLNGYILQVEQEEFVNAALNLESKKWSIEKLSEWLKENSIKEN